MAGYSQTPLWRKLGLREGGRLILVGAPEDFAVGELPASVDVRRAVRAPRAASGATVVAFKRRRADLSGSLPPLARAVHPDGAVWIAWPRRAAGGETDIRESDIRDAALPLGLVDVKVAALAEQWSGLRLVWRRERRGEAPSQPPE